MLFGRHYVPAENELLYHYCSADTFLAICTTKRLRFSDLFSMNDFMEIHWGYHIWEQAAGAVLDQVGRDFLNDIDLILHTSGIKALALASCFSRNGDVLSQWRAYGDDGRGYAIGFKAAELVRLPISARKVEYGKDAQVEEVRKFILALHEVEKSEENPRGPDFFNACATLAFDLASFKNPAFKEEDEVRLVHLVNFKESNGSLRLVDPGGEAFGRASPAVPVAFHMSRSTPVPHIDIDFADGGNASPVAEVILGPKNDSLLTGISVFLETLDIANVKIRKSSASYR